MSVSVSVTMINLEDSNRDYNDFCDDDDKDEDDDVEGFGWALGQH